MEKVKNCSCSICKHEKKHIINDVLLRLSCRKIFRLFYFFNSGNITTFEYLHNKRNKKPQISFNFYNFGNGNITLKKKLLKICLDIKFEVNNHSLIISCNP